MAITTVPRSPAAAQAAWRGSRSRPRTATMALSRPLAASSIAFPRKATRRTAVSASKTPAA